METWTITVSRVITVISVLTFVTSREAVWFTPWSKCAIDMTDTALRAQNIIFQRYIFLWAIREMAFANFTAFWACASQAKLGVISLPTAVIFTFFRLIWAIWLNFLGFFQKCSFVTILRRVEEVVCILRSGVDVGKLMYAFEFVFVLKFGPILG